MNEYTQEEDVTGVIGVWAIPRPSWAAETDAPFTYGFYTGHCYSSGAVKVCESTVKITVPAGINLFSMAVETLEAERAEALKKYMEVCNDINERLTQLRLLTGTPTDDGAIEGFSEVLENSPGESDGKRVP